MAIIKNINAEKIQGRLDVTDVSASYLKVTNNIVASTITADLDYSNVINRPTLVSSSRQIATEISGSFTNISGSFATRFDRLSYAITGSNTFEGNQTINGDVNVNGKLTASSFNNVFVSSSTIYTSGSTKFGDTVDDKHQFTGSVEIDGGLKVQYGINANWFHGDVDFVHLVNAPRFVSSSIQIGSEISGSFTRVSSSLAQRISDLDNVYATDIQLSSVSGSIANDITYIRDNFAFASNVTSISQSFASTIGNLDSIYATDTQLSAVSSSLASRIDGISTDFYDITNKPTLLSGSAQIASEISGSFTAVSASFASTISNLGSIYATDTELSNVSASFATFVSNLDSTYATDLQLTNVSASFATTIGNLDNNYATDLQLSNVSASLASSISNISTDWPDITNKPSNIISSSVQLYNSTLTGMIISGSFSGSYIGDGSGLTGVQTTVVQNATAYDTFTSATSKVITHNFGTKNVIVSVYDSNDAVIIPTSIITTDTNTVTLGFEYATTGRAVVAKGGHIVSGSLQDYTYREGISGSSSYTITHNLNEDFPVVQVYDTNKEQVIPAKVKSTSTNAVLIEFINSFTGTVVVKK